MPEHYTSMNLSSQVLMQQECVRRPARARTKSTDPTQKATDPSVREVHTVNSQGGVRGNPRFHIKPLPPKGFQ